MIEIFLMSLLLGAVAGVLAGLFGLGGGLVIVPVLVWMFDWQHFNPDLRMIMAVATSLATIVPTAMASVKAHHQLGAVIWCKFLRLFPGIVVGAVFGAMFADKISADSLRWLFIAYLCYVGSSMALQLKPVLVLKKQEAWQDYIASTLIGGISSLLGIGGGTLTVPYLVGQKLQMKNAVAVSSACGLPIALAGAFSYALLGWNVAGLPDGSVGYVYVPAFLGVVSLSVLTAPYGAKLAHHLPAQELKRYFSIMLFILAVKMML